MSKLTKLGVRDLSHLPEGPSRGRVVETPSTLDEKQRMCPHPKSHWQDSPYHEYVTCTRCGHSWESSYYG